MQAMIPDSLRVVLGHERIEDCLKKIHNVGETIHMDVCNGGSYAVPWGQLDWIAFVFVGVCALSLIVLFIFLVLTEVFYL